MAAQRDASGNTRVELLSDRGAVSRSSTGALPAAHTWRKHAATIRRRRSGSSAAAGDSRAGVSAPRGMGAIPPANGSHRNAPRLPPRIAESLVFGRVGHFTPIARHKQKKTRNYDLELARLV